MKKKKKKKIAIKYKDLMLEFFNCEFIVMAPLECLSICLTLIKLLGKNMFLVLLLDRLIFDKLV